MKHKSIFANERFFKFPDASKGKFPLNYQYIIKHRYTAPQNTNGACFRDYNTPFLIPEGFNKPISKIVNLNVFNKNYKAPHDAL